MCVLPISAIAGQGLALVSDLYARPAIEAGWVIPVLEASSHTEMAYYLVSAQEQADDWKINIFRNWIKTEGSLFFKRSEERSIGKECVSKVRSRWSAYH